MHTIYTIIAAKVNKIDKNTYKLGPRRIFFFGEKFSATDLIQELPSELRSIDRVLWSIDRKWIDRNCIRSIDNLKCAGPGTETEIEQKISLFFFFF
jgi:hypothetical protein